MTSAQERSIVISIRDQKLSLFERGGLVREYAVSTALNGHGEQQGSGCTPLGCHKIRLKIGADQPSGSVFIGRRPTGEVHDQTLSLKYPERDWILSRIIWLTGAESGRNRGGPVDTLRRFIYIHGTPDHEPMGIAKSHGCIRMHNEAVIDLFDRVEVGDPVEIDQ